MTNVEKIIIIANQLANNGKKPTVALIKSKLTHAIPLPQIIGALKNWQHDPENCTLSEPKVADNTPVNHSTIDCDDNGKTVSITLVNSIVNNAIEQALAPIKNEITLLKQQLEK